MRTRYEIVAHWALRCAEILILSVLILATRCANYQDVFVGGNVYFTDADCYARMIRVRMCAQHPGLVLRHHEFENYPAGTSPHTTTPLDYLIVGLSMLLSPFARHAIDLAGALISPLLALVGGCFFWWWSRQMTCRFRWALLALFAISPILVHGTLLGRPDHQSLLIVLVGIAFCAEWTLRAHPSQRWSIVSGCAWGAAVWVSAYEPLVLLLLLLVLGSWRDRSLLLGKHRRIGWIVFGIVLLLAFAIERRIPSTAIFDSGAVFKNWARTIGELLPVSPLNSIWFRWTGYMIVVVPILIWFEARRNKSRNNKTKESRNETLPLPPLLIGLLIASYCLTLWQARWAYFFVLIFAIILPALFDSINSRLAVWFAFLLSLLPILRDWDEKLWPNESEFSRRLENRHEGVELRELALNLMSAQRQPFLAPWWLSPSIAYWSGQPGVAGSSHESLPGTVDSARFFLTQDESSARIILQNHHVFWVLAYDADRVEGNSAIILGTAVPPNALGRLLDQRTTQVAPFLVFSAQNGTGKLFRVAQ